MSSIRHIKKAMKNSSGFLSIKVGNYWYPVNEWDRIEYHKRHIIIYGAAYPADDDFITFFYKEIKEVHIY